MKTGVHVLQNVHLCCVGVGEVLLVDGLQLLVEEKEVGPEVLPEAELLPTSDPSDPNLEKGLSTSEILKCEAPWNQWEEERGRRNAMTRFPDCHNRN